MLMNPGVIAGDYLYIDPGFYRLAGDVIYNVNSTFTIDLRNSWLTYDIEAIAYDKPPDMRTRRAPMLWFDSTQDRIYEWGGWADLGEPAAGLWSTKLDENGGTVWEPESDPVSVDGVMMSKTFASAWATSPTNFYTLSGVLPVFRDSDTHKDDYVNTSVQGLSSLSYADGKWSNSSSDIASGSGYSVFSRMTYVPNFGAEGVLIVHGGEAPSTQHYDYLYANALVDMSLISIYDIATAKWFLKQTETGIDVPGPRKEYCSVGAMSADNSTFEIFIFGGEAREPDVLETDLYRDVYILSLPAFKWFRAQRPTTQSRINPTCQNIQGRHMLVMGGTISKDFAGSEQDSWINGLQLFDMTDLSWTYEYNASGPLYERPSIVQEYYSNNPPPPELTGPLRDIFRPRSTTTTSPTTPSSTSTVSAASSEPASHTGAIAGGVVGGVIGLGLICFAVFMGLRRKRKATRGPRHEIFNSKRDRSELEAMSKHAELHGTPMPQELETRYTSFPTDEHTKTELSKPMLADRKRRDHERM